MQHNPFLETFKDFAAGDDEVWLTVYREGQYHPYTKHQFVERVEDYCFFFNSRGIECGSAVLIILKESLDLYAAFWAATLIGAIPAYFSYPSKKQSGQRFLDGVEHLLSYNRINLVLAYDELFEDIGAESVSRQVFDKVALMSEVLPGEFPVDKLIPQEERFLQFSSGTTGAKKGVLITGRALSKQISAYSSLLGLTRDSKIVSWLPHYHDMGLIACMLMPMIKNIPICMMSPFEWVNDPKILFEVIQKSSGTHVWLPNFSLGHLTKSIPNPQAGNYDLSTLQSIVCCSEPVLKGTVSRFFEHFNCIGIYEGMLSNCYAMAENTFAMTTTTRGEATFLNVDYSKLVNDNYIEENNSGYAIASVGKPIAGTELRILDENGISLGENRLGEIYLKSDCMLDEYHNNPEVTEAAFKAGWFNTGDTGFFRQENLYVVGRTKDTIVVSGENMYPQDIESIINQQEGFLPGRNVVFGVLDEDSGTEVVVLLAEVEDGATPDIKKALKRIFDELNVSVRHCVLLLKNSLIKSTAGKASRALNKEKYLAGGFTDLIVSREDIGQQRSARDLIDRLFPHVATIGITSKESLFDSGLLDSMAFSQLLYGIEEEHGFQIPDAIRDFENFESIEIIEDTIKQLKNQTRATHEYSVDSAARNADLQLLRQSFALDRSQSLKNAFVNAFPFKSGSVFKLILRWAGMDIHESVRFLGDVRFKVRGRFENIRIGAGVVIGNGVDIRNRENGKIIIGDRCAIDDSVRLVAARDGEIVLGDGTEIGRNSLINSGGKFRCGSYCLIASSVHVNTSTHGTHRDQFVKSQPHSHGSVILGNDIWIGSGASILINSRIGDGCIVGGNAIVSGSLVEYGVYGGNPLKLIRKR